MSVKAAVIGAGPLGLLAAKNLKEQGFDITVFERRRYVGGLWQHSNEDIITVNPNTVFNSSRFRCAFTDYPFPDDTDDYPTCQQSKQSIAVPVTAQTLHMYGSVSRIWTLPFLRASTMLIGAR